MIVLWSEADLNGSTQKIEKWLDEHIVRVDHQRDPIPSHVKTTVRAYGDGYKGTIKYNLVYNHYVPYSRISKALIGIMEQNTRNRIIIILQDLITKFRISTPRFSKQKDQDYMELNDGTDVNPTASKFCFHFWCNHIYQNICDWPRNIFLGPSIGDSQGKAIDLPIDHIAELSHRLVSAVETYHGLGQMGLKLDVNDEIGGLKSYSHDNKRDAPFDIKMLEAEKKAKVAYQQRPKVVYDEDEIDEFVSDLEDEAHLAHKGNHFTLVERKRLKVEEKKHRKQLLKEFQE